MHQTPIDWRAVTRRLFDRPEADPAPPERTTGNHVPGEGANPHAPGRGDNLRRYTRELFGHDPDTGA